MEGHIYSMTCFQFMTQSKCGPQTTPMARGGEHTPQHKTEDESQIYKVTRDHQVGPDEGDERYRGESSSNDDNTGKTPARIKSWLTFE